MGQAIGLMIEIAIGQLPLRGDQSDGLWRFLNLSFEQVMKAAVLRIGRLCLVPLEQQLAAFRFSQ